jgi:hypothetical protein
MSAPTPLPPAPDASDVREDADVWDTATDLAPASSGRTTATPSASEIRLTPTNERASALSRRLPPLPSPAAPPPPPRPERSVAASTILPPPTRGAPRTTERLRVSVRISVRDPGLFVVRPLPEGAALPTGTREGFLVMTNVRDTLNDEDELVAGERAAGEKAMP